MNKQIKVKYITKKSRRQSGTSHVHEYISLELPSPSPYTSSLFLLCRCLSHLLSCSSPYLKSTHLAVSVSLYIPSFFLNHPLYLLDSISLPVSKLYSHFSHFLLQCVIMKTIFWVLKKVCFFFPRFTPRCY